MPRLTNQMREDIITAVIAHTFNEEIKSLNVQQAGLALDIYNDFFTPTQQKTMEGLPQGWLLTDDDIMVRVNGSDYRYRFNGAMYDDGGYAKGVNLSSFLRRVQPKPVEKRFPANKKGQCLRIYDRTHVISERATEWHTAKAALFVRMIDAFNQLTHTLASFSNTDKLIEAWPEIAPFVPAYIAPEPAQLPAVPTATLNNMFKLPVVVT